MMHKTRVVTVAGNVDAETTVAEQLARHPQAELVLRCLERTELLAAVRGARVDVVLVVGVPAWLDPHVVSEAAGAAARVVGFASDPLEAEAFRRLGIGLSDPEADLTDVLLPIEAADPPPVRHRERSGRLIAVWGPKGAPGRSTVAVETAAEIAATEPLTALVDADTYGGDISQMLAVVEELPTIVWAAQAASDGRLDEAAVTGVLRRAGETGPVLLPGINRAELWTDITGFGWSRLLEVFEALFAYTVVDVGFGIESDERVQFDRDRLARQTIMQSDRVVAVCRADPVGIKTFLWSFERLKEICDLDQVYIVANRVAPGDEDEIGYVLKKHLGKRPVVYLPDRSGDARSALDRGVPMRDLKPSGEVSCAIRDLASALGAHVPARGLLTRLAGRR